MDILSLLPAVAVALGGYLMIKLRFFFILHPIKTAKKIGEALGTPGAVRHFFLSLAGTLGVGNIVGVSFSILVSGAGSVLWLLVSSLFAMILKYAESSLAADMKRGTVGGMMLVLSESFPRRFRPLAYIYSLACLLLALSMGAALQARAALEAIVFAADIPELFAAGALAALVAFAIVLGVRKIEGIVSFVIPIAAVAYIVIALTLIVSNISRIPSVVSLIVSDALRPECAVGGFFGFIISDKLREGFLGGLLSNEAGAGTSAMAHARSEADPASAGLLGMCEVFFDTVVLCMLTAFAVLLSVPDLTLYSSGMEIVLAAVSGIGNLAPPLLAFSIFAFAYSTVLCWYYYGKLSFSHLFGEHDAVFAPIYILAVFVGALVSSELLVRLSDILLLLMTLLTALALVKNTDRLVSLSVKCGVISKF